MGVRERGQKENNAFQRHWINIRRPVTPVCFELLLAPSSQPTSHPASQPANQPTEPASQPASQQASQSFRFFPDTYQGYWYKEISFDTKRREQDGTRRRRRRVVVRFCSSFLEAWSSGTSRARRRVVLVAIPRDTRARRRVKSFSRGTLAGETKRPLLPSRFLLIKNFNHIYEKRRQSSPVASFLALPRLGPAPRVSYFHISRSPSFSPRSATT